MKFVTMFDKGIHTKPSYREAGSLEEAAKLFCDEKNEEIGAIGEPICGEWLIVAELEELIEAKKGRRIIDKDKASWFFLTVEDNKMTLGEARSLSEDTLNNYNSGIVPGPIPENHSVLYKGGHEYVVEHVKHEKTGVYDFYNEPTVLNCVPELKIDLASQPLPAVLEGIPFYPGDNDGECFIVKYHRQPGNFAEGAAPALNLKQFEEVMLNQAQLSLSGEALSDTDLTGVISAKVLMDTENFAKLLDGNTENKEFIDKLNQDPSLRVAARMDGNDGQTFGVNQIQFNKDILFLIKQFNIGLMNGASYPELKVWASIIYPVFSEMERKLSQAGTGDSKIAAVQAQLLKVITTSKEDIQKALNSKCAELVVKTSETLLPAIDEYKKAIIACAAEAGGKYTKMLGSINSFESDIRVVANEGSFLK
jgi:hypothetical protein